MRIKDMNIDDRPREKLLRYGPEKLEDYELLAILLKTGTKDCSVRELSKKILDSVGGISKLKNTSVTSLKSIKGIGPVKVIELCSLIELGKRIYFEVPKTNKKMLNAKDIYDNFKYLFVGKLQEEFYVIFFNNKQELIKEKLLFKGTIDKSIVHPREIFKEAFLSSASSIICIHNHPSGSPKPSKQDIIFTENIVKIGKMCGIPVLDHIIVCDNIYYSFNDENKIFNIYS